MLKPEKLKGLKNEIKFNIGDKIFALKGREMAKNNILPEPFSLIEKILEMQEEINCLSKKIDNLEKQIKEQK